LENCKKKANLVGVKELPQDIESLHTLLRECFAKISSLEAENADLRSRLGQTSQNSHRPPSSDGYKKQGAKTGIPKTGGKKQGGQEGHTGKTLEMVSEPDVLVVHHPVGCSCCGRQFGLEDLYVELGIRRQVFDIPLPKMEVTEHRVSEVRCCGQSYQGEFPSEVSAPVQYGVRSLTLASVLNVDFRMPFAKIRQLFADIYGISLNESTIISGNESLYITLEKTEQDIKEALLEAEVAHFDETGMRVEGKLHWFHTVCNVLFCYIFVHTNRGQIALESKSSLLPDFTGWAVHDGWASYFNFDKCQHVLCNAHILRELQGLIDKGSLWAALMKAFLLDLYQTTQQGTQVVQDFTPWETQYEQICQQADKEEPPPEKGPRGKPKNSKGRNLYNRLVKHQSAILSFAQVEVVPFTNNRAEQDIRVIKIKQKVAMSFRTFHGAEVYARIQGVVKTIRKQGGNLFQTLLDIRNDKPCLFRHT
jgi:transposase